MNVFFRAIRGNETLAESTALAVAPTAKAVDSGGKRAWVSY